MTDFPAAIIESGVFTEHHGILVGYVGEDGDVIALGHHDHDKAKAAVDAFAGPVDYDYPITASWAVLTDPPTHDNCVATADTSCSRCDEIDSSPWWLQWDVAEDTRGAFPVMVVEA